MVERADAIEAVPYLQVAPGVPGECRAAIAKTHAVFVEALGEAQRTAAESAIVGAVDRTFHGAGYDRTIGMRDRGVVENLVAEQRPILHETEHKTDDPVILLAHEPDIFPRVPKRIALTLAGHTHGGQIKPPFVEPVWAPSAYGARFAYGHIVEQNRHMIVSGGLGSARCRCGSACRPEIVRVTLGA